MKYDPVVKRRPTNVSLSADLVSEAKQMGINISRACRAGLEAAVRTEVQRRWQEEHREAINRHNAWVEKNGIPLSDLPIL